VDALRTLELAERLYSELSANVAMPEASVAALVPSLRER